MFVSAFVLEINVNAHACVIESVLLTTAFDLYALQS